MAAPTADRYVVASGQDVYAGRGLFSRAALAITTDAAVFAGGASASPTALALACASLTPGVVTALANTSLNTVQSNGTKPWEQPNDGISVPMLDWANHMEYDPGRKIIVTGGGRPYQRGPSQKVVWYDEATNVWADQIDPWGGNGGGHIYNASTVAPGPGMLLSAPFGSAGSLGGGSGWVYKWNLDTKVFAGLINPPANGSVPWDPLCAVQWMPNLGAQGSLLFYNKNSNSRIMRLDWASQVWSQLATGVAGYASIPAVAIRISNPDIALIGTSGGSNGLAIVNGTTGAVTTTANPPTVVGINGSAVGGYIVMHPNGNTAVLFSNVTQRIYEYDPGANTWTDRGALPATLQSGYSIYCALPSYGAWLIVDRITGPILSYLLRPNF